jgi:hypothetical protein
MGMTPSDAVRHLPAQLGSILFVSEGVVRRENRLSCRVNRPQDIDHRHGGVVYWYRLRLRPKRLDVGSVTRLGEFSFTLGS